MSGSTAEACRPSGYFLSWSFAQARFSGVKAKSSGCSAARRRTLMGWLLLLVSGSGARARRRLLAEYGAGGDVGQALLHIGLECVIANRDRRFFCRVRRTASEKTLPICRVTASAGTSTV